MLCDESTRVAWLLLLVALSSSADELPSFARVVTLEKLLRKPPGVTLPGTYWVTTADAGHDDMRRMP